MCEPKFTQAVLRTLCVILFAAAVAPMQGRAASDVDVGAAQASKAVNILGQRVFDRFDKTQKQTVLISPLNLGSAIAQLAEGAQGATRADLLRLFDWHGDGSPDGVGRAMDALLAAPPSTSGVTLQMANALWVDQHAQVRASFSELEKRYFGTETRQVDFSNPSSAGVINAWVADQTHGQIKNIVSSLDPATQIALTSALYFKGLWADPFDPAKTKPGRFTVADGHELTVPFMHRSAQMDYLGKSKYQAVSLPFYGWDYSIVFVVPRDGVAQLPDTTMRRGSAVYDDSLYKQRMVRLFLPRLKLSWNGDPLSTLRAMANLPFGKQADYGVMSPQKLAVSKLPQQVTLELDEKGVTATATGLSDVVTVGAWAKPPAPVTVRLDRPFDFFIRNDSTGAIVVMGHVVDPGTRASQSSGSN